MSKSINDIINEQNREIARLKAERDALREKLREYRCFTAKVKQSMFILELTQRALRS